MPNPIFVSFEGIDGSGKSTQARLLHRRLAEAGYPAVLVREPGSTPLGDHLRAFLKGNEPITPMAELFAFQAARAELLSKRVLPSLEKGTSVVADRHTDSSIAYQGAGRGLPLDAINYLNNLSTQGTKPHITFLLHIDPAQALLRQEDRTSRYESQPDDFKHRVAQGYTDQAAREPDRIRTLDATLSQDTLSDTIWTAVHDLLTNTLEHSNDRKTKQHPPGPSRPGHF